MSTTTYPSGLRGLALASARAHWPDLGGTFVVLAAAGAVTSLTGALVESGLRGDGGGALVALASSFAGTALVVTLLVVTSTLTLALRQRRRELALLRAVGATSDQVRRLVSLETAAVTLAAVPAGAVPALWGARLLTPLLERAGMVPAGFEATLSPLPVIAAVLLVLPVAVLSGRLATREALAAPPSSAVRTSTVEPDGIGRVRAASAVVLALSGLSSALSPVLVPGTAGAAAAGTSALLLVAACACAGPVLVRAAFGTSRRLAEAGGGASTRLALSNVHGFSRRMTAVVVPLGLVISLGTMSAAADRTIERAAHDQLAAAVRADLVASPPLGATMRAVADLGRHPGVAGVAALGSVAARVRVDDELPGALGWEDAPLLVVDPAAWGTVVDPGLRAGSADDLARPGTVALSRDAALETGARVGRRLPLRVDGRDLVVRVVATYDRGLGLGPYVVGPATAAAAGASAPVRDVLVQADAGTDPDRLRAALADDLGPGWTVVDAATWTSAATSPDAAGQRLSTVLLLILLSFVALGAANALVLSLRNRRGELALLHRTGATRRQLVAMVAIEALVCAGLAWLMGTLTVLPAVVAMQVGLLGAGGLAAGVLPLLTWAALSLAVLVLAVGTSLVAVVVATRAPAPARSRPRAPQPATA